MWGRLRSRMLSAARRLASPAPYRARQRLPAAQRRSRIAHVIGNFSTGGSSQLVVDLIERLGHLYEQEVIVPWRPSPAAYRGPMVHESARWGDPRGAILAFFRGFRPDLVHVHYWEDAVWYPEAFAAAQEYGCRVVENVNTPVAPYRAACVRRYVYVSEYVRAAFGSSSDRNHVTIHPGSDFSVFTRRSASPAPEDCIGMVCRLESDKLNERSIDPFIRAVQLRPRTRCLIVGGGTFLRGYKAAVAAAGLRRAFTFAGYVSYRRLPSLYERMSLFVAPVWKESFGQVAPFAMGMGLPVVGYRVGGLPEILGSDRHLARPGDSEGLAGIIVRLLDDRRERLLLGEANRTRARALFGVEAMVERYRSLYDELLRESP